MRWIWIDRFVEFESGVRAVALKNVSLAEEQVHDILPGVPMMPASLMIEGLAQTAGILVGEARQFREKVVLAKINEATFHHVVRPGDQLRYEATLDQIAEAAAVATGKILREEQLIGSARIFFSHADRSIADLQLPEENFVFTPQFVALLSNFRDSQSAEVTL